MSTDLGAGGGLPPSFHDGRTPSPETRAGNAAGRAAPLPRWAAVTLGLAALVVAASFVPGILDGTWLGKTRGGKLVALSGLSARWMGGGMLALVLVMLAPLFGTRRTALTWLGVCFGVAAVCTGMAFLAR